MPGRKRNLFCLFFALFFLWGCAARLPSTLKLTASQEEDAALLLKRIQERSCPKFIDADVTLTLEGYGQSRTISATLQAQKGVGLRVSLLDPLFRPFMILAADSTSFTLVDNRQGRGYTGSVDSSFLRDYIPAGVQPSDSFSFLTGRLPSLQNAPIHAANSAQSHTYWFVFAGNGWHQHTEIDPDSGYILRNLLVDADGQILLDMTYDSFKPLPENECFSPMIITVAGKDIKGSVKITLDKMYSTPLSNDIFQLRIPDHFIVTEVE